MKIDSIMSHPIVTVGPEATLREASVLMAERGVGFLCVVEDGEAGGTLTDRDLCIEGMARGLPPSDTPVARAMSPYVVACERGTDLLEAAMTMTKFKVRRLVVLDKGKPVGVVSVGDLARRGEDPVLVSRILARTG